MKNALQIKNQKFERRRKRIRAKISGTKERPRLSIFKSHKYVYVQLVDDDNGCTLAAFNSRKVKGKTPAERAKEVGLGLAKEALAVKIKRAVFDKGGYLYAGKIKLVAEGAREGGLEF
ncbi:50S ribosomal protein L18 [Patescibacteria group bacterium]|nr:50S ribosomal protein L18 [Patescibacteria group bacterium]MDE1946882.1 50S ribosomal protein L18 [Patescibacteria group bacterium]MDE2010702.1 50S ribosomal protein L18 [Patescibacteria group bacterium]MDE2232692.1 50S ribosomal protein L18 [Patescibacteria group bacterium]